MPHAGFDEGHDLSGNPFRIIRKGPMAAVIKHYYFCPRKIVSLPLSMSGWQVGVSAPPNHEGRKVQRLEDFSATFGERAYVIDPGKGLRSKKCS